MNTLLQQYRNALAIIKQINNGEWEFTGHYPIHDEADFHCYVAKRNRCELWVSNGPFFCGIRDQPWQLGIFGILVWYGGAGKYKKLLEKAMYRRPDDLTK